MRLNKVNLLLIVVFSLLILAQVFLGTPTVVITPPVGIIIPHHDLAREYIISSLSKIAQRHQYSTIVVVGPNHFLPAATTFLSTPSLDDYPIETKMVSQLLESGLVESNSMACERDHSLGSPLRYLKEYFPNAKFVPILAPMNFKSEKIINLAKLLTSNLPEETLYVASVDFSHGKSLLEAMGKNLESENAIESFDYGQIYQYQDDHLDSPASIGLLLNSMQNIGATKWSTTLSSHGSLIEEQLDLPATSYLIGIFSK